MKKILKWTGIVLGGLIGLVVVAAVVLYASMSLKLSKRYNIQPEPVNIPSDAASIQRGEHLVSITCEDCHGADLSGKTIFTDPLLGTINGANLTSGKGGAGADFSDADWVLAIRHGVDDVGRPLIAMPSASYYQLSDADLGDIIAYLKTLKPVDNELSDSNLKPAGRILAAVGLLGNTLSAASIDHTGPRPVAPQPGKTAEYGNYLIQLTGCRDCHGANLSGGKSPDPSSPPAPSLTSGSDFSKWTVTQFIKAMREGVTPENDELDNAYMPWKTFAKMTDDELEATWLYLHSLPSK